MIVGGNLLKRRCNKIWGQPEIHIYDTTPAESLAYLSETDWNSFEGRFSGCGSSTVGSGWPGVMVFGKLSFSSTMGEGAVITGVGVCRCSGVMEVDADAALFLVAGSALVEREGSFLFLPSMIAASLVDSGIILGCCQNASRSRWCKVKVLCRGGVLCRRKGGFLEDQEPKL